MTNEEQEVIEAAKRLRATGMGINRLWKAVDALPKPYESLVSDDELVGMNMRAAIVLALRRMSARLAETPGLGRSASEVAHTAHQEEEL